MGDEEDPWGFDDSADSQPVVEAAKEVVSQPLQTAAETANTTISGTEISTDQIEAEHESFAQPPPPPEDDGYRKPVQLYRHWVRPKFLQYKYMYNYRTNYYNDVIDYLDKKMDGINREIPRPQTWAERVLRTNTCSGSGADSYSVSNKRDKHLIQTLAASIRTYNYHTRAYINQKYAHVL